MKDVITIDKEAIIIARDKASNITLTVEAKSELEKILAMKKLLDEVYEYVQEKLSVEMEKEGIKKIVAGNIVIAKRYYGSRYKIDNQSQVDERFKKEEVWVKPNSDEIDKYFEETGEMPSGISLKERSLKATITERSSDE